MHHHEQNGNDVGNQVSPKLTERSMHDERKADRGEQSDGADPARSRDHKEKGSDSFDAAQEHEVRVRLR